MGPTRRRSTPKASSMVLTGLAGLLGGVLVFAVVVNLVGRQPSEPSVSAATFDVGPAEARARSIARDGPFIFLDPLNRSRDIFVQHLGGEDWRAFSVRSPGATGRCVLEWQAPSREFVDRCDGRRFPADGTGLVSYPTTVNDDERVIVDLRSPIEPAPVPPPAAPAAG